jgi:hypothetical protein
MIIKITAEKRHFNDFGWLKTYWLFSFSNYHDEKNMEFGSLRVFNDDIVMPNTGFPNHPHDKMEIVTIVLSGKLTHKDSMGNEETISSGEVQRMSAGEGVVHSEYNKHKEPVHLYQLWFYPNQTTIKGYEQKKIVTGSNKLTLLVSQNDKKGVLLRSDATIWQLNLNAGEKSEHELDKNKGLFIYITNGIIFINGNEYKDGDQARITGREMILLSAKNKMSAILVEVDI